MSIEELKQKFDAACTELSQDADTVVETHFFITAYMKKKSAFQILKEALLISPVIFCLFFFHTKT